MTPLAWRAGAVPECSALAFDEEGLTALIATRSGPTGTLSCIEWNLGQLEPISSEHARPRGRYAMDPSRSASALELLCSQTLQRPAPSIRLFIEGYYMRTLVLAHGVDELVALSEGTSLLNAKAQREGLVLRPLAEVEDEYLGRLSFKAINPKFLLKYDE